MSVIPKIASAIKTFAGKPMGLMSKALGAATCAAVLYDSHINGKEEAISTDRLDTADRFEKNYKNYISSGQESATICKLKKLWYESSLTFSYPHIFSRAGGYAKGFSKTLFKGLPLLALSVVAIRFNKIGKIAGAVLAGNGIKTLMYDVAGIGSDSGDK